MTVREVARQFPGISVFGFLTDGSPEPYARWAARYYARAVDLEAVRHVFALRPLTPAVVSDLNPEASLSGLADSIAGIGYPLGEGWEDR